MHFNFPFNDFMKYFLFFSLLFIQTSFLFGQSQPRVLGVKKTTQAIKIDGDLSDAPWQSAALADGFKQVLPYDTSLAKYKTEVKVTFDETFLYVSATCYQRRSEYIVPSLKRDPGNGTSDLFFITLDTFKDRINAFYFGVSPLNVQKEGLIVNGGEQSNFWDNKWYSAVKNEDDKWTVEMAIPFKTLRYRIIEGDDSWRVQFARNVLAMPELSSWSPIPRNFRPVNQAFSGTIVFEDKLPKPGSNISVIPFISGGYSEKYPRNSETLERLPTQSTLVKGIGFDAKIGVTPSLNLDLTVNPDFSQVEVDRQVTNLSRFEIFFPERRQFFLENSDLFDKFGFPNTRPFFSRRIGIAEDTVSGNNMLVPILAGARLSGKLNDKWRIGLLNMQTRKKSFSDESKGFTPAANFTVGTLQRRVLNRSYISGIVTSKANDLKPLTDPQKANYNAFNRTAGLEFNFYSENGEWEEESYIHQSFSPIKKDDATSTGHFVGFNNENIDLNLGYMRIGQGFEADMGYVPRNGVQMIYNESGLTAYPKNKKISKFLNSYGVYTTLSNTYALQGKLYDREFEYGLSFNGQDRSEFSVGTFDNYTYLPFSFDPTNSGGKELSARTNYRNRGWGVSYTSSNKYKINGEAEFYTGQYFNGSFNSFDVSVTYRIQPLGTVSMSASYNDIRLPQPFSSKKFLLLSPRAELSFSRSVFFSTFLQYNVQANNFNINSRLQWRFKPVSDIYLVYTDNYFAESVPARPYGNNRFTAPIPQFAPKNRALVLKITYWLNV